MTKMTTKQARIAFPEIYIERGAQIDSSSIIEQGACIGPGFRVKPNVYIGAKANIGSGVYVGANTHIGSNVQIGSGAHIWSDVVIEPGAHIGMGARVGKTRKNVKNTLVINGIGETKRLTAHDSSDGLIIVVGYFNKHRGGTPDEFLHAVKQKYPDRNHPYYGTLEFIKTWYANLKKG